jgi:beta-mannanase
LLVSTLGFVVIAGGFELNVTPSFASGAEGITHAAHIRPTLEYGDEILDFNSLAGKNIGMLMYFLDWSGVSPTQAFDPYLANKIQEQISNPTDRPVIMLTWQPMKQNNSYGCTQTYNGVIPPADVIAGNCDAYITQFALDLKSRSERFLLRFAHEMNITDSPWWPGNFGGDASLYVQMWQHVYDLFTAQSVTNVEWVWSPNYASNPADEWNGIHNYYPGNGYVDWIGLSGYNWYNTRVPAVWRTFEDLYDEVLKDFACSYAKPQVIAEIGSVEGGGAVPTKADWILDAYQKAENYPFLRSIVWFNDYAYANPSGADFRVTTGTAQDGSVSSLPVGTNAWTNAYNQALSDITYVTDLPTLNDATPSQIFCNGAYATYLPLIWK